LQISVDLLIDKNSKEKKTHTPLFYRAEWPRCDVHFFKPDDTVRFKKNAR